MRNFGFPHIPETCVILKILYIHVENDLAHDSSMYNTCPLEYTAADLVHGRKPSPQRFWEGRVGSALACNLEFPVL